MNTFTSDGYFQEVDRIRASFDNVLSNCFLSSSSVSKLFNERNCHYYTYNGAILLFIPYHNKYYDVIYYARDTQDLCIALNDYIKIYNNQNILRISVIGNLNSCEEISSQLKHIRFKLVKKLGRVVFTGKNNEYLECLTGKKNISDDILKKSPDDILITYASKDDITAIYDILIEHFDLISENIPERAQIMDAIKKGFVVVAKKFDKVIAVHYFEIRNNIRYCIYDVVRKEFRKLALMPNITEFVDADLLRRGVATKRSYGWRDIENKRLLRAYQALGEVFDGVYIFNHIYEYV